MLWVARGHWVEFAATGQLVLFGKHGSTTVVAGGAARLVLGLEILFGLVMFGAGIVLIRRGVRDGPG